MNPNLRAALDLAGQGKPVFPCKPSDKKPIPPRDKDPETGELINGTGGLKKASTDVAQISAWWHDTASRAD
jgi:putative DNA primase/helicase